MIAAAGEANDQQHTWKQCPGHQLLESQPQAPHMHLLSRYEAAAQRVHFTHCLIMDDITWLETYLLHNDPSAATV